MGLPLLRNCRWQEVPAEAHCRDRSRIPNPWRGGACMRACAPCDQHRDSEPGLSFDRRLDRSIHRASPRALPRRTPRRQAGRLFADVLSLREVVQISQCPKNPKGLAPKTVRSIYNVMKLAFKSGVKWGYLRENPMAAKRVELPRGSTKRTKQPVQLTPAWFFLLLTKLPLRERLAVAFSGWLGPRISEAFGLKWQDLDLDKGVGTFRRGFVQGRITLLKTGASRANLTVPGC